MLTGQQEYGSTQPESTLAQQTAELARKPMGLIAIPIQTMSIRKLIDDVLVVIVQVTFALHCMMDFKFSLKKWPLRRPCLEFS